MDLDNYIDDTLSIDSGDSRASSDFIAHSYDDDEAAGYDSLTDLDDSSSEDETVGRYEEMPKILTFREKLANCFTDINLEASKGNEILKVLREHQCLSDLPADHRTLVGTPQIAADLRQVHPGEYLHLGVEITLVRYLEGISRLSIPESIHMDFSTDGANLDKYGFISMWPIQIRPANIPKSTPLIVGIYRGRKKPSSPHDFFADFVREVNNILRSGGVLFNNRRIPIILRCFTADTPARAFILNHKGHTGSNNCSKCDENGVERTNEDYRNQVDESHHHGSSPLADLPFDLVNQVVFDWQHLSLSGSLKRQIWATVGSGHNFSKQVKLSSREIDIVDARLLTIRSFCPREFSRRPGKITDYGRWKATEFRQLVLYTGSVVFYGIYKDYVYNHFLLYHTALRCLAAPQPSKLHLDYANIALEEWEIDCPKIYGENFPSYNVQGHKHLSKDVENFGPLDCFSTFPYENHMQVLRRMCRKPDRPLQQIARRIVERCNRNNRQQLFKEDDNKLRASQQYNEGPIPCTFYHYAVQYKLLKTPRFTLGINNHDNCCILEDSSICIIRNILVVNNQGKDNYYLIVNKFSMTESWFNAGIESGVIGSFKCMNLNPDFCTVALDRVSAKCYRMPFWPPNSDNLPTEPLPNTYIITVML